MLNEINLPDLSFKNVEYSDNETHWNLNTLLFHGAGWTRTDLVAQKIKAGTLGLPDFERLELLLKLHEEISFAISGGGSRDTAFAQIRYLRSFAGFADSTRRPLTIDGVVETYCAWADALFHRTKVKNDSGQSGQQTTLPLKMRSAYNYGAVVGTLLDRALNRHTSVIELTKLSWQKRRNSAVGIQSEKQSLSETFQFGHLLQDICDGLPLYVVLKAPLPVQIKLRSEILITRDGDKGWKSRIEQEEQLKWRYPIANLRIEAELLMFIGQTGMNLKQAANLELRHFFYFGYIDGYQVKDYKNRRGGVVLFEIFKEYKPHFERYLEWRRKLFPSSTKLFPFVTCAGTRPGVRVTGSRTRAICKELSIAFITPSLLRNTRVNWLLRQSADPELTAEMAQHTKQTLLRVYEKPSVQRTIGEVPRFWLKADPHAVKTEAVGPGACAGMPLAKADIPRAAPTPDCMRPSGCLWCQSHRDVDSFDYVWALTSFSFLKVIELSKGPLPQFSTDITPAQAVIDHVQEMLRWFSQSDETRNGWVEEARARWEEGDFHPNFKDEIKQLEGSI